MRLRSARVWRGFWVAPPPTLQLTALQFLLVGGQGGGDAGFHALQRLDGLLLGGRPDLRE